jgi:Saxitoxin biosynthesis operon protein SxtJ
MAQQFAHESLTREEKTAPGSERSFAIVMAIALALVAGINWWWYDGVIWLWLLAIAATLLVTGFRYPAALKPLNWLWFKFGLLLHAIVSPLIMGLVFYTTVLPTGLVMRAMGKDPLRLKSEPESDSYWIARQPPGPPPETMKDQF